MVTNCKQMFPDDRRAQNQCYLREAAERILRKIDQGGVGVPPAPASPPPPITGGGPESMPAVYGEFLARLPRLDFEADGGYLLSLVNRFRDETGPQNALIFSQALTGVFASMNQTALLRENLNQQAALLDELGQGDEADQMRVLADYIGTQTFMAK